MTQLPTSLHYALGAAAILLPLWLLHLGALLLIAAPLLFFARHRVDWTLYDLATLIAPIVVWSTLMLCSSSGKSLGNLIEGLLLTALTLLAPLLRVTLGNRFNQRRLAIDLLLLLSLTAVSIWAFVPPIAE